MFRSVFLPTLFSGFCRVRFGRTSRHSHRKALFIPSKSRYYLNHSIPQAPLRSFVRVGTCSTRKKNYTSQQKVAPALP